MTYATSYGRYIYPDSYSVTQGATNGQGTDSQGYSTADLIGRIHAAGGTPYMKSAVTVYYNASSSDPHTVGPVSIVNSDFPNGGYGGGGNVNIQPVKYSGVSRAGAAGGQGFAMIAWGSYKEDLGLT